MIAESLIVAVLGKIKIELHFILPFVATTSTFGGGISIKSAAAGQKGSDDKS